MNTYTKILKLKKGSFPPKPDARPGSQPLETNDSPNDRTVERMGTPNGRTGASTERPNDRTVERGAKARKTERYSYEFYADQVEAIRKIRARRELAGETVTLSDIVREAVDAYLQENGGR